MNTVVGRPAVSVVVHDVGTATLAACERLVAAIAEVAPVPLTLLAVPRYHGEAASPSLEQWLGERSRRGDEIALHGYSHRDEGTPGGWIDGLRRRHYTRSEGEFWSLDRAEAATRMRAGIDWFAANGWPLHGFVAPAWLLGPGAWEALRDLPFSYTSTLRHVHLLPGNGRITSQSVVYSTSSAWRRQFSVVWAAAVAASLRSNPLARIELHPGDAEHPAILASWQRLLQRQLRTREATTMARFTAGWRDAAARAASLSEAGPGEANSS